jgi:hypothetical protein
MQARPPLVKARYGTEPSPLPSSAPRLSSCRCCSGKCATVFGLWLVVWFGDDGGGCSYDGDGGGRGGCGGGGGGGDGVASLEWDGVVVVLLVLAVVVVMILLALENFGWGCCQTRFSHRWMDRPCTALSRKAGRIQAVFPDAVGVVEYLTYTRCPLIRFEIQIHDMGHLWVRSAQKGLMS